MGLEKSIYGKIVIYFLLILWLIFALFPLYFSLITSIKSANDVYAITPKFLPWIDFKPTFETYINMFKTNTSSGEEWTVAGGRLPIIARNSFLVALGAGIGATLLGSMAAYGLARFQFQRWKNEDIGFFLFSQRIFPAIALAVPYFILFNRLHMLDKIPTLILVYIAMNVPLVIWLLWDFFADLPVEIEESALVDGCSRMGAFFRIALPLAAPGLVVAFLFAFVFSWNEFLYAFTLTFNDAKTLPFVIAGNVIVSGPRFWDISAQGTLVMLPPILIALLAGRYIVRGLTLGAVK